MARRWMSVRILVLSMTLALLATGSVSALADEDEDRVEEDDGGARASKRSYVGDANSRWFHVGGGVGAITPYDGAVAPIGRFVLGGGGYTFGFYATGGLELSGTEPIPVMFQGVGGIGVHIPIPVVHPMLGVKIGGGIARFPDGPTPVGTIGGQFGMIVREYDGRVGFRVLVEPAVSHFPFAGVTSPEIFVTLALVL